MRLPTKSEIDKAAILERQVEAQEGMKLARKVDEVRLEVIKEQNTLSKLKNETSKIIQAEIDALLRKRENLQEENDVLKRHNSNLKAPFDEEWENIRNVRLDELDDVYENVKQDKIAVDQEKAQISLLRSQIEIDKKTTEARLDEASNERLRANKDRLRADSILENAKIHQAEVQSRIDAENNQLDKKKEEVALQLRDVSVREAALQKSARELARRERFINSKYKVLMNTQRALEQKGTKIKALK